MQYAMDICEPAVVVNEITPIANTTPNQWIWWYAPTPKRMQPKGIMSSDGRNNHSRYSAWKKPLFRRANLRMNRSPNSPV